MRLAMLTAYGFMGFVVGGATAIAMGMVPPGWLIPMCGAAIGAGFALGVKHDEAD